jgi:ribosomal protein S8
MARNVYRETLTTIRNALLVNKRGVEIPITRKNYDLIRLFLSEGLIEKISESRYTPSTSTTPQRSNRTTHLFITLKYYGEHSTSVITNLKLISRSRVRYYVTCEDIPIVSNVLGMLFLSTSSGLMTGQRAVSRCQGGELICSIS